MLLALWENSSNSGEAQLGGHLTRLTQLQRCFVHSTRHHFYALMLSHLLQMV